MVAFSTENLVPVIGAHPNLPFLEYTRWQAINWHTLAPFRVSARQGHYEMALPPDSTDDMKFGAAFHTALLEPHLFESQYAVMPRFEGHPNSNAYKAQKADWLIDNAKMISLTRDEKDNLEGMQRAVAEHPVASALLRAKGRNELSIVWRDEVTQEICKGRVDRLCRVPAQVLNPHAVGDVICLVDLKKTSVKDLNRFDTEVAKWGYHGQLAFYLDGLQRLEPAEITALMIVVQDSPPYDVAVFTVADAVEHGRRLYRRLLDQLLDCRKRNYWPGVCPVGTIPVMLPAYAKEKEEGLSRNVA